MLTKGVKLKELYLAFSLIKPLCTDIYGVVTRSKEYILKFRNICPRFIIVLKYFFHMLLFFMEGMRPARVDSFYLGKVIIEKRIRAHQLLINVGRVVKNADSQFFTSLNAVPGSSPTRTTCEVSHFFSVYLRITLDNPVCDSN